MATSQSIDSRLPAGNPKLLVDVDVERTRLQEYLLCYKNINKTRVSTGCTLQDLWLVGFICTKLTLFSKLGEEEARLNRSF